MPFYIFGVLFLFIFGIASPVLMAILDKNRYQSLSKQMHYEWHSRTISSIHAISVSCIATWALISDEQFWLHPFNYSSWVSQLAFSVSMGYAISDYISLMFYLSYKDLFIYFLHHGAMFSGFYLANATNCGHFFGLFKLLTEYSTPFANHRWFLLAVNKQKSDLSVLFTTFLYCVLFAIFRLLLSIPFWIMAVSEMTHTAAGGQGLCIHQLPILSASFYALFLVFDVLNVYWCFGVYRLFKSVRNRYFNSSPHVSHRPHQQ